MVNDDKIKVAFSKIKTDMSLLKHKLEQLEKAHSLNDETKQQIKKLKELNIENFVKDMENEFTAISTLIKEFNERFKKNSSEMETFANLLQKYHLEIEDIKKSLLSTEDKTENTSVDLDAINTKIDDLQELLTEKIELENNSQKLEINTQIADIYSEISKQNKKFEKFFDDLSIKSKTLEEINTHLSSAIDERNDKINDLQNQIDQFEIIDDSISDIDNKAIKKSEIEKLEEKLLKKFEMKINEKEKNNIKLTQKIYKLEKELAQIKKKAFDDINTKIETQTIKLENKISSELAELKIAILNEKSKSFSTSISNAKKHNNQDKNKNADKDSIILKKNNLSNENVKVDKKKESKIKKIAKWLFVDEEDEDEQITSIKGQVRNK